MDDRTTTDFGRKKPGEAKPVEPTLKPQPFEAKPLDKPAAPGRKSKAGGRFLLLVFLGGAAAAGWWFYSHQNQGAQQGQQQGQGGRQRGGRFSPFNQAMPVVVAPAAAGDIDITLNALGTVTPLATVTIRSQISGYLVNIHYQEGQVVRKGDPLAEIDDRTYQLALKNAESALARDQALLTSSELDLKRYQDLAKTNAIPRQQLDQQVATVAQNKANIQADQSQIETQKLNIAYCHIVAPVNGRVGLRLVDQGNYVTPGDSTGLVVITQFQPITVIFPVAEDNLPPIAKRLREAKTLPVTVFDRSGARKLATGELKTIDNQIDTSTGTVKLRAEFANDDEALYPNQFVNVRLLIDTLKGVTVVPSAAIQRGAPGAFVYLVNDDQTVSVKPVKLGPANGDRVSVREGLSPGDRVVIDGADKLRNGAKIVAHDANGEAAAGSGGAAGAGSPSDSSSGGAAAHVGDPGANAAHSGGQGERRQGGGNGSRHRRGSDQ